MMITGESHSSVEYLRQGFFINTSSNMYVKCILYSQTLLGVNIPLVIYLLHSPAMSQAELLGAESL